MQIRTADKPVHRTRLRGAVDGRRSIQEMDINEILQTYLGADEFGSYRPIGIEKRFMSRFGDESELQMERIQKYLDYDHEPDWTEHDLIAERDIFFEEVKTQFPELNNVSCRALANRFAYAWK